MKKNILGFALVALVIVAIITFSNGAPKEEVTIGVLVPLTGASASIGERVKAGIEAGVAEIRATGGYPFTIVFEDDKGDATTAVSAAQKLMVSDGVRIIIGTVKSDSMLAVAPITEAKETILISPTAGSEGITNAGDFVFRVIETPNIHGEAAATYLGSDKKVALFVAKAANAQSYGKFFKSSFENIGGTLAIEAEYNPSDTDFRTHIGKALSFNADSFYLAVATARDAGIITKQVREAGFKGPIMMSVAADGKEFFDTAGIAAEGAIISAPFFDKTAPESEAFNARYKAITGNDGDGFSANGYDAMMLIANALQTCGGDEDTKCMRDFLYATKEYKGVGGTFSFDQNGDVTKPVTIKIAKDGQFITQ